MEPNWLLVPRMVSVIVWNYFSNNILVQNNYNLKRVVQIEWNPFRQDMLATLLTVSKS